jgi:hypothetical protein
MDNSEISAHSISATLHPGNAFTFNVIVRDARGESRNRMTIGAARAQNWTKFGAEPSRCVEAVMRFLLNREPKESILGTFDTNGVRRYLLQFNDAFPQYLVRLGGEPRTGA